LALPLDQGGARHIEVGNLDVVLTVLREQFDFVASGCECRHISFNRPYFPTRFQGPQRRAIPAVFLRLKAIPPLQVQWHVRWEKHRAVDVIKAVLGWVKAECLEELFRRTVRGWRNTPRSVNLDDEFEFDAEVAAIAVDDIEPERLPAGP
jgi:hypothetical protein